MIPELERVRTDEDRGTYFLNMGPQHPSMHGVLRLVLELEGERIVEADPVIGYSHRAHEKMAENRSLLMFLPNTSRIDYLSGMIYNLAWCQAIERWVGIEVPERAEYIRIIVSELNRISSHLLWLGTFLLDIGGITPFLYAFEDREEILGILDRVTGSRLTYCYGRFGGVTEDVDDVFVEQARAFTKRMRTQLGAYDTLLTKNVILRERCIGVGVMDADLAQRHGVTGPCLRSCGIGHDLRKDEPYGIYDRFDFEVPVRTGGDAMDRYLVRIAEMEQSLNLVDQALDGLPEGPILSKKVTQRIRPPAGEFYFAVESARGHFGTYVVSDGSETPVRVKLRTPSFSNLSTMKEVLADTMIADTIAIVGSVDVVMPEIDR